MVENNVATWLDGPNEIGWWWNDGYVGPLEVIMVTFPVPVEDLKGKWCKINKPVFNFVPTLDKEDQESALAEAVAAAENSSGVIMSKQGGKFESDAQALAVLEANDIAVYRGMIIVKRHYSKYKEVADAVLYLCNEFDYDVHILAEPETLSHYYSWENAITTNPAPNPLWCTQSKIYCDGVQVNEVAECVTGPNGWLNIHIEFTEHYQPIRLLITGNVQVKSVEQILKEREEKAMGANIRSMPWIPDDLG